MVINILSVVLIGFALGMFWECLIFLFAYIPIRSYAGGYHANTPLKCYLFSLVLVTALLLEISKASWNSTALWVVSILAGLIIFWLSPVEDSNKPLDQIEITIYRKRTYIILAILLCLTVAFWKAEIMIISISIMAALEATALLLILGVIKNRLIKRKAKNSLCV